jgi:hypothetical protein
MRSVDEKNGAVFQNDFRSLVSSVGVPIALPAHSLLPHLCPSDAVWAGGKMGARPLPRGGCKAKGCKAKGVWKQQQSRSLPSAAASSTPPANNIARHVAILQ